MKKSRSANSTEFSVHKNKNSKNFKEAVVKFSQKKGCLWPLLPIVEAVNQLKKQLKN